MAKNKKANVNPNIEMDGLLLVHVFIEIILEPVSYGANYTNNETCTLFHLGFASRLGVDLTSG